MKIALVSQEYPPETARGGIGSQTYAKAVGLSARGHEIFVISRSVNGERTEIREGNITVIRIPGLENLLPLMTPVAEWITHSVVVAAEIESLASRFEIDIVDFPEWGAEGFMYLVNRNEWTSVPTVIQLHGPLVMLSHTIGWPEQHSQFYRVGSEMEAECIRSADGVYSSSSCSIQWVHKYYEPGKADIPVIHLGIDTETFSRTSSPKRNVPTILFIGKIVRNKGVEELVEAAAGLEKQFPGLKLRMIGHGDDKYIAQLMKMAENQGAQYLLEFPGFIQKEQLPEELTRAHVFAAPSWYEGGPGFVYLEAMACELPVIGCSGSGVEEIIEHEENGLLVPPQNAAALQEALYKMLSDQRLLREMGKKARKYILENCDRQDCLTQLEAFYESVIAQAKLRSIDETLLT